MFFDPFEPLINVLILPANSLALVLVQKLRERQLAQRKGKLDLTAGKNQFKLQLIAMRKKAFAQMKVNKQVINTQTTEEVTRIRQQPAEAKARSEERRQFTDHINGKTIKPRAGNPVTALFN